MTRAELRAQDRRWRRGDLLAILAALVLGAALAWIVISIQALAGDLRTANEARDALASQVQGLGEKPVGGPPGSRGEPSEGPPGPRGHQGEPGPSGPTGPSGKPGPSGPAGGDGTDGVSQTGPPGQEGVAGPPGAQGEPGPAGPQGQPGLDGADGQTCPAGYSLQAPAGDADALVCRRDGAPAPGPEPPGSTSALDPFRRQYP